ncbi:MAG: hypothetical protein H0V07_02385, partial [Propionibacteriales bacterium]|nr:hypothetical protein [Propionibacteriales bacterium]
MDGPDLAEIRSTRRELDEVIEEIRQVPGFKHFLTAPTFDEVQLAAQAEPLAYVSATDLGGFALVVRSD